MTIKLSVIIPIYNAEQYLKECIDSIINQTYHNFELILVDDGSTDSSGKMCDDFQKAHNNIKVIHKKNGGASDARNCGIQAATGDYMHFLDSDDVLLLEDIYAKFMNIVEEYSPDIIFSRCATYSADFSEKLKEQNAYTTIGFFEGDILFEVLNKNYELTLTSPVNKLFKREFIIKNELLFAVGIDHEEDEWLPRVISNAKSAYFYNALFYGARYSRPGALSETKTDDVKARKACSKIYIAHSGINYMKNQALQRETLSLAINYYWDYLIDACVAHGEIEDYKNTEKIIFCLREHKNIFDSYKYLKSKNRRVLGIMFKFLGIKITLKFVKLRYCK